MTNSDPKPSTRFIITPLILLFLVSMVLANIARMMHQPLTSLYIESLGADVQQIGLFFTLATIAPLLFQIFGGWLSDVIGRLQAIAIGSVAGVIAYVIYWWAPTWEWVLLATLFAAITTSFVRPSFDAFIAEQSSEENRGRVYGITEMVFQVVGIIGPLVGGFLAEGMSFKILFFWAGVLYAAAAVIRIGMAVYVGRRETKPREKPSFAGLGGSLKEVAALVGMGGIIMWIFVTDGARDVAFAMSEQFRPLYLENLMDLDKFQIASLTTVTSITTMVMVSFAGAFSDKRGEHVGIALGFVLFLVAQVLFLIVHTYLGFALAWVFFGAGEAFMAPAYQSLISKAIPRRLRGTAFGLFSTSAGFFTLPAPYIGAWLWETFTPQVPFYLPMVFMVAVLPIIWFKFRVPVSVNADLDTPDAA